MRPNALLIGSGEYTTGLVHSKGSSSDKKCGVVALVFFDLRRRGLTGDRLGICGTSGTKFPAIREFFAEAIGTTYPSLDFRFESFPEDSVSRDTEQFRKAIASYKPGDLVTIFTPDDTHFEIAMEAIQHGLHVLVTKPAVMTLEQHWRLIEAARKARVLVAVEVHKRWDPVYEDARNRIRSLGDFSFFTSYMSQPKKQLETFKNWAGKSSDISYYLNSHHIDFHSWALQGLALPMRVVASCAKGISKKVIDVDAEDTITLLVDWKNLESGNIGTASYTASWAASISDVHSQQRFFYLGHQGEITVDQAHRGYYVGSDSEGFRSVNPLYMRYVPDSKGNFVGQNGYGYKSFEAFVEAASRINSGEASPADFDESLATIESGIIVTAVLEAGRRSLDSKKPISIVYNDQLQPIRLEILS